MNMYAGVVFDLLIYLNLFICPHHKWASKSPFPFPLQHITNYKTPREHESITARWLWTPAEKITRCGVERLSLEVAWQRWGGGGEEKRACNALIGGLFWKCRILPNHPLTPPPSWQSPPQPPSSRPNEQPEGVGQPFKLNESLDCIFSQHWFPGCAHDHHSMSGPLIKYQRWRRLSPDCHWYHWELLFDRLAHFIPKEEVKRAARPLCSVFCALVCFCLQEGSGSAPASSSGAPVSIFPQVSTPAFHLIIHLHSIKRPSCCSPSCTALLLAATLKDDGELQFGSKCSRDVSPLCFNAASPTRPLHSAPVSPSSVYQSWS